MDVIQNNDLARTIQKQREQLAMMLIMARDAVEKDNIIKDCEVKIESDSILTFNSTKSGNPFLRLTLDEDSERAFVAVSFGKELSHQEAFYLHHLLIEGLPSYMIVDDLIISKKKK